LEIVGFLYVQADLVPLEYSIVRLSCAFTCNLDAVMAGWPGAAQDRLPAGSPDTQPHDPGIPLSRRDQGEVAS
jgi:hypothetical protein